MAQPKRITFQRRTGYNAVAFGDVRTSSARQHVHATYAIATGSELDTGQLDEKLQQRLRQFI
jgi:hypothetical protein